MSSCVYKREGLSTLIIVSFLSLPLISINLSSRLFFSPTCLLLLIIFLFLFESMLLLCRGKRFILLRSFLSPGFVLIYTNVSEEAREQKEEDEEEQSRLTAVLIFSFTAIYFGFLLITFLRCLALVRYVYIARIAFFLFLFKAIMLFVLFNRVNSWHRRAYVIVEVTGVIT